MLLTIVTRVVVAISFLTTTLAFLTIRADSFLQACRRTSGTDINTQPANCLVLRTCCIDKCRRINETYSFSCKSPQPGHELPEFACHCYKPIVGQLDRTGVCQRSAPQSCSSFASCCRDSCPGESFQVSCRSIKGDVRDVICECVREPVTSMELTDHCKLTATNQRCVGFSRCCLDTCAQISLPYIAVNCKDNSANLTGPGCKCSSHLFSELSATEACRTASSSSCKGFGNCCRQSCPPGANPLISCSMTDGKISTASCSCAQSPIVLRDSKDCLADVSESADCNSFGQCCKNRCAQRDQSYSFTCKNLQGKIANAQCECRAEADAPTEAITDCSLSAGGKCPSFESCCEKTCRKSQSVATHSCQESDGAILAEQKCSCSSVNDHCEADATLAGGGCKEFEECCRKECKTMGGTYTMSCKTSGNKIISTKCRCI